MTHKKSFLLVGCFLSVVMNCFAQKPNKQWFFSPNWNLYIPTNTSNKGTYPIIGYDKESSPKLLIGGYGIGVSVLK